MQLKARRQLNLEKAFNLRHTPFDRKDTARRDMCERYREDRWLAGRWMNKVQQDA